MTVYADVPIPGMPDAPNYEPTNPPGFRIKGEVELEFTVEVNLLDLVMTFLKEFLGTLPDLGDPAEMQYFADKVNAFLVAAMDEHCAHLLSDSPGLSWNVPIMPFAGSFQWSADQMTALEGELIQRGVYSADEERARLNGR